MMVRGGQIWQVKGNTSTIKVNVVEYWNSISEYIVSFESFPFTEDNGLYGRTRLTRFLDTYILRIKDTELARFMYENYIEEDGWLLVEVK